MSGPPVIPLFPLSLVVFPGQLVPLHIFEERYKSMIADCRAGQAGEPPGSFGICLARDQEIHGAGCTAAVHEVLQEYEDGRLDLLAQGLQRFRVLQVFRDRPYLTAAVEYFEDQPEPEDAGLVEAAVDQYRRLLAQLSGPGATWVFDAGELPDRGRSFYLAQRMGLAVEQKQALLETRSENQRLRALAAYGEQVLSALSRRQERKERARSNGRAAGL